MWKNRRREADGRLVESYRTQRGPRQRTVAYLGQIDEADRLGVQQATEPRIASSQRRLFAESEAQTRYVEIDRTRVPTISQSGKRLDAAMDRRLDDLFGDPPLEDPLDPADALVDFGPRQLLHADHVFADDAKAFRAKFARLSAAE